MCGENTGADSRMDVMLCVCMYSYYFMITPQSAVTMWLSLDDADEANGCLVYVKDSASGPLREHQVHHCMHTCTQRAHRAICSTFFATHCATLVCVCVRLLAFLDSAKSALTTETRPILSTKS